MSKLLTTLALLTILSISFAFDVNNPVPFPSSMTAGNNYTALFSFSGTQPGAYYAKVGVPPELTGSVAVMLNTKPCALNGADFICNETLISGLNLANLNLAISPNMTEMLSNLSVQFLIDRPDVQIVNMTNTSNAQNLNITNTTTTQNVSVEQNNTTVITPPTPTPEPPPVVVPPVVVPPVVEPPVVPPVVPEPVKKNDTFGLGVNITNVSVISDVPISGEMVGKEIPSEVIFPSAGILVFLVVALIIYFKITG